MGGNKSYRLIAIIAIIVGAIGVAVGYSAFSSNLIITSSAEVNPNSSDFSVVFSSAENSLSTAAVEATLSPDDVTGFSATDGTINNSGGTNGEPTITNLKATFTEPGQTATYTFYARNTGNYIAYLKGVTFSGNKTCTPRSGTTDNLVQAACNGISMTVKVGSENATSTTLSNITQHSLAKNGSDTVIVTITYAANSGIADGIFDVTFPSVTLNYSSVD